MAGAEIITVTDKDTGKEYTVINTMEVVYHFYQLKFMLESVIQKQSIV